MIIRSSLLLLVALLGLGGARAQEPIPVLLVTGANNHDWEYTSVAHAKALQATGRFAVTVTTTPAETLADRAGLARYRAFVLDYNGPRWGEAAESAFLAAVEGGAGVVVIHAADNAFEGWTEYETLVGHLWRQGTGHGRFHEFGVDVVDRNHPITADLPPMIAHPDELYHKLVRRGDAPHRVLMSAFSSTESGGTGKDEPMAVVLSYGRGRVFHTPLGHVWRGHEASRVSIADPQLRLLIARGTEWAATGACTIPVSAFGLEPFASRSERPRDPWVFRCVLDDRPRMVVALLDAGLGVAYDAARCQLHKVWSGGVRFDGSVWTGAHGPQPTTQGRAYETAGAEPWRLVDAAGATRDVVPVWRGYRLEGTRLVLWYEVRIAERTIRVEESPEHGPDGGPVLVREFRISGLAAGESLEIPLGVSGAERTLELDGATLRAARMIRLGDGAATVRATYTPKGDV